MACHRACAALARQSRLLVDGRQQRAQRHTLSRPGRTAVRGTGAAGSPQETTRSRKQNCAAGAAAVARTTPRRTRPTAVRLPCSPVRKNYTSRHALANTARPPRSRGLEDYSSRHAPGTNMADRKPRALGLQLPARRESRPSLLADPAGTPIPPSPAAAPRRPAEPPARRRAAPAARLRLQTDSSRRRLQHGAAPQSPPLRASATDPAPSSGLSRDPPIDRAALPPDPEFPPSATRPSVQPQPGNARRPLRSSLGSHRPLRGHPGRAAPAPPPAATP
ncbi:uncharacterized protein J5F26_006651 isoform 2-T2 [Ciconia maguari]